MTVAPPVAPPLTRGPRLVRDQLIGFLGSRLPPALATAREAWHLTADELPDPVRYTGYELLAVDERIPAVSVAVARSNRYTRTDYEREYAPVYACTVYGWLRAVDYEPPQQMRDDFASVLVSLLLDTPSLGGVGFRFEENTLEVNYSDAVKVKGDRWLAGVSLAFTVAHVEQLRQMVFGTVDLITVEATLLGAVDAVPTEALSQFGDWRTGVGPPAAGLGWSPGEYYLDTASGDVYRNTPGGS